MRRFFQDCYSTPYNIFWREFSKLVQHRIDDSRVAVLVSINPLLTEVGMNLIGNTILISGRTSELDGHPLGDFFGGSHLSSFRFTLSSELVIQFAGQSFSRCNNHVLFVRSHKPLTLVNHHLKQSHTRYEVSIRRHWFYFCSKHFTDDTTLQIPESN